MASISLVDQALSGVSDEWRDILTNGLDKILQQIDFTTATPPIDQIFNFARLTPLEKIRVVIIGQDPYHTAGEAHGLAFSSLLSIPPSLKNIYKCLIHNKLIDSMPTTGNLTMWAVQGILLVNCALTTRMGKANAHAALWSKYTDNLFVRISRMCEPIWLLWGNFAKNKRVLIEDSKLNNMILTYAHPSPLAQHTQSFTLCDHFTIVNTLLYVKILYDPAITTSDLDKYHRSLKEEDDARPKITPIVKSKHDDSDISFNVLSNFDISGFNRIVVFTDGSCNPNKLCPEAIGSYAACFVIGPMQDTILYGKLDTSIHYASNQRAEGTAIYKTLQHLYENLDQWTSACIVSDSDFWIKMFTTYMPQWDLKGISFSTKLNSDITSVMYNMYKMLTIEHEKNIEFRHCKSHNKSNWGSKPADSYEYFCYLQNSYVDTLATFARTSKKIKPGDNIVGVVPKQ
jgi:uracil-DNA glycosylase